jgi:hydroxymethylpyrimidine pyrophosphatase-like HAD family hydrolase
MLSATGCTHGLVTTVPGSSRREGRTIVNRPVTARGSGFGRIRLLASDYDGTLADHGAMKDGTVEALRLAKRNGLALALVTGREFDDLLDVCEHLELFDVVVAEDGAVVYRPDTSEVRLLAEPPDAALLAALTEAGIAFSRGRVIVSTQGAALPEVRPILEAAPTVLHVSLNKGAAMYLPPGIDKAAGLRAGLEHLAIGLDAVAAFGDAENDLAFLRVSGLSVAVANALDSVKEQVDIVLDDPAGDGVAAFIRELVAARHATSPRGGGTRASPDAG